MRFMIITTYLRKSENFLESLFQTGLSGEKCRVALILAAFIWNHYCHKGGTVPTKLKLL